MAKYEKGLRVRIADIADPPFPSMIGAEGIITFVDPGMAPDFRDVYEVQAGEKRLACWDTEIEPYETVECYRCHSLLNNIDPGYSVVKGGRTVCANCLRPGEEILRARSL